MLARNQSGLDRVIRNVLGLALIGLVFVGPKSPWGLVGLVLILTGVVGFCPIYRLLGISTRHRPHPGGGPAA